MAPQTGSSDWISAYLEWTGTEFGASGELFAVSETHNADAWAEESATVYLEWMDEPPAALQREAVLLMALRTEAECMHMLRQALDDGEPTPHTLRLAMEALDCAKTLLDDERRAWRAIGSLHQDELPRSHIAWDDDYRMDWRDALENVEADVRALSGRILELRAH